ncbi:hypothetical protein B0T19DRAFT_446157 [Cercophora scortea]|uniref:Uncharacterized protein n=1 Tax=Cercophora scortea TaxID=314031 RepID=A0AAE0I232_9PEZI|nr:hypothetical protein B0T19DRAFT_446157 [Cercophora scortea]
MYTAAPITTTAFSVKACRLASDDAEVKSDSLPPPADDSRSPRPSREHMTWLVQSSALATVDRSPFSYFTRPRTQEYNRSGDQEQRHPLLTVSVANMTASPLLRLPLEIRRRLYDDVAMSTSCLPLAYTCRQLHTEVLLERIPFAARALGSLVTPEQGGPRVPCKLESLTIHVDPECEAGHSWLRFDACWLRMRADAAKGHAEQVERNKRMATPLPIVAHVARSDISPNTPSAATEPINSKNAGLAWVYRFLTCNDLSDEEERYLQTRERKFRAEIFLKTSSWSIPSMEDPLGQRYLLGLRPVNLNIVVHAPSRSKTTDLAASFMVLWQKMTDVQNLIRGWNEQISTATARSFSTVISIVHIRLTDTQIYQDARCFWALKPNVTRRRSMGCGASIKQHKAQKTQARAQGFSGLGIGSPPANHQFWGDRKRHAHYWELIVLPFVQHTKLASKVIFTLDWGNRDNIPSSVHFQCPTNIGQLGLLTCETLISWLDLYYSRMSRSERSRTLAYFTLRVIAEVMAGTKASSCTWGQQCSVEYRSDLGFIEMRDLVQTGHGGGKHLYW